MKLSNRERRLLMWAIDHAGSNAIGPTLQQLQQLYGRLAAEHELADGEMVRHTFEGTLDLGELTVTVDEVMLRRMLDSQTVLETHMQHVVDTRQELVREAMIELGWQPPRSSTH